MSGSQPSKSDRTKPKGVTRSIISEDEFRKLVEPLIGLPVSRVWRGAGSAIFLEIGKLFKRTWRSKTGKRKITSMKGQFGVMIQWSWRVERPKSISFGSWSSDRLIDSRFPKLKGHTVTAINVEGRLPELVVQLSGGFWVHSFAAEEGQPEWCLFLDRKQSPSKWLKTDRGHLCLETKLGA